VYPAMVGGVRVGVYGFDYLAHGGCKHDHTLVTPAGDIDLGHSYEYQFTPKRLEEVLRERGVV